MASPVEKNVLISQTVYKKVMQISTPMVRNFCQNWNQNKSELIPDEDVGIIKKSLLSF